MKHNIAEAIGRKARALKHCNKIIQTVDKQGRTEILLGNTGVSLPCEKNDAIYTLLQSIRFKIIHEINSMEIVSKIKPSERTLPAPTGACEDMTDGHTCVVCGKPIVKVGNQKYCKECAKAVRKDYLRNYKRKK